MYEIFPLSVFGNFFTKENNIRGLIYLIRDPRDIAISWSKHSYLSLDNSNIKDIIKDANINYKELEIKNKKLEKNQEKIYSNIEDELQPLLIEKNKQSN